MPLNLQHIDRTRSVLNGIVPLSSVFREFSNSEAAVLAVTLLCSAGKTSTTKKGEYGQLLETICKIPSVPAEGFKANPDRPGYLLPDWWENQVKYWPHSIVAASRTLGLHVTTRGSGREETRLIEQPIVRALLNEPGMAEEARKLYDEAMQRYGESMPYGPTTKKYDVPDFRPTDLPAFTVTVNQWPEDESMRSFIGELRDVFEKYFPESR